MRGAWLRAMLWHTLTALALCVLIPAHAYEDDHQAEEDDSDFGPWSPAYAKELDINSLLAETNIMLDEQRVEGSAQHHFAAYSCNQRTYSQLSDSLPPEVLSSATTTVPGGTANGGSSIDGNFGNRNGGGGAEVGGGGNDDDTVELFRGLNTMLTPSFPRHTRAGRHLDLPEQRDRGDHPGDIGKSGFKADNTVTEPEDGLRQLRLSMVPPFLDWAPSELCSPVLSSVDVINLSPDEDVTIHSIVGDESHFFYGSDEPFEPVTVEPLGNISVPLLFVPQTLGLIRSTVTFNTNVGEFAYRMQAVGIANAHGIRPVNATVTVGMTYQKVFSLYNPYSEAVRVLEVVSAEDDFQFAMPTVDVTSSNGLHPAKLWKLEPEKRRPVITLSFSSKAPATVHGFVLIRTEKDMFVVSVEVAATQGMLVPTPARLDFGTMTKLPPHRGHVPVSLLNAFSHDVQLRGLTHKLSTAPPGVTAPGRPGVISAILRTLVLTAGAARTALELNFTGYEGFVTLMCTHLDRDTYGGKSSQDGSRSGAQSSDFKMRLPFSAEVTVGGLQYRTSTTEMVVGGSGPAESGKAGDEVIDRTVEVSSTFEDPLLVLAAFTLDPAFEITGWRPGILLQPRRLSPLLGVRFHAKMARESVGRYLRQKGVVGHEMLFGDALGAGGGVRGGDYRRASGALRVYGERAWDDNLNVSTAADAPRLRQIARSRRESLLNMGRLVLVTNATTLTVPLAGYNGRLAFSPYSIKFAGMRPGTLRRRYFNVTNHNPVPINLYQFVVSCKANDKAAPSRSRAFKSAGTTDAGTDLRISLVSIRRPKERVLISGLVAAERLNQRNAEVLKKAGGNAAASSTVSTESTRDSDDNGDDDTSAGGERIVGSREVLTTLEPGYSAQFVAELNASALGSRRCMFRVTAGIDTPSTDAMTVAGSTSSAEGSSGSEGKQPGCKASNGATAAGNSRAGSSGVGGVGVVHDNVMDISISSSAGAITFTPAMLRFEPSFPGRIEEQRLCLSSTHRTSFDVTLITSSDERFIGSVDPRARTVPANGRVCVGTVLFDPSRRTLSSSSAAEREQKNDDSSGGILLRATLTLVTTLSTKDVSGAGSGARASFSVVASGRVVRAQVLATPTIQFPLTQLGKQSEMWVEIHNPSNFSITARLAQNIRRTGGGTSGGGEVREGPFAIRGRYEQFHPEAGGGGDSRMGFGETILLGALDKGRLGPIVFTASVSEEVSDTFTVLNNLTQDEPVLLRAKGGRGVLSFWSKDATRPSEQACTARALDTSPVGSTSSRHETQSAADHCDIAFNVNEDELRPLIEQLSPSTTDTAQHKAWRGTDGRSYSVRKVFSAQNSGDMPIAITQIEASARGVGFFSGSRLSVSAWKDLAPEAPEPPPGSRGVMVLQPRDTFEMAVSVSPDFSTAHYDAAITLATSNGALQIPLAVRLPRQLMPQCTQAMALNESTSVWMLRYAIAVSLVAYIFLQMVTSINAEMEYYDPRGSPRASSGTSASLSSSATSSSSSRRASTAGAASHDGKSDGSSTVTTPATATPLASATAPGGGNKKVKKVKKDKQQQPASKVSKSRSARADTMDDKQQKRKQLPDAELQAWKHKQIELLKPMLPDASHEEVAELLEKSNYSSDVAAEKYWTRRDQIDQEMELKQELKRAEERRMRAQREREQMQREERVRKQQQERQRKEQDRAKAFQQQQEREKEQERKRLERERVRQQQQQEAADMLRRRREAQKQAEAAQRKERKRQEEMKLVMREQERRKKDLEKAEMEKRLRASQQNEFEEERLRRQQLGQQPPAAAAQPAPQAAPLFSNEAYGGAFNGSAFGTFNSTPAVPVAPSSAPSAAGASWGATSASTTTSPFGFGGFQSAIGQNAFGQDTFFGTGLAGGAADPLDGALENADVLGNEDPADVDHMFEHMDMGALLNEDDSSDAHSERTSLFERSGSASSSGGGVGSGGSGANSGSGSGDRVAKTSSSRFGFSDTW